MQRTGEHHLYLGLVYIPPKGSVFQKQCDSLPAYDILQRDIVDVCANEGLILLAGEFNARTGCLIEESVLQDFSAVVHPSLLPDQNNLSPLPPRKSADEHTCAFGKLLLNLCETSDLRILNGRTAGDETGMSTCHIANGKSVVDYCIASRSLINTVASMTGDEECPPNSGNRLLSLKLMLQPELSARSAKRVDKPAQMPTVTVQKIRYDPAKIALYTPCPSLHQT